MILLEKALFLIGIISYLFIHAKAVGESKEDSYFREHIPGRLFNVGTKRYVSFYKHDDEFFMDTEKKNLQSARLFIRTITDGPTPYAIITSGEEKHLNRCKISQSEYNTGSSKQFLGCPALTVLRNKKIGVQRFDRDSSFKFSFSLPVLPRYHAIRILHNKKCLGVRSSGELSIEECEYKDMYKRSNQLFIWIDEKLFDSGYNPLSDLDQSKNPENPYYDESGSRSGSVWE